jgi:hypothetical protein
VLTNSYLNPTDPTAIDRSPFVVEERTRYGEITRLVRERIESHPTLTEEEFREIVRAAYEAALAAAREAYRNAQQVYRTLYLFPGMTSTDLRAAESEILEYANEDGGIDTHARTLRAEGMSINAIAHLLGLSRWRIRQIVDDAHQRKIPSANPDR